MFQLVWGLSRGERPRRADPALAGLSTGIGSTVPTENITVNLYALQRIFGDGDFGYGAAIAWIFVLLAARRDRARVPERALLGLLRQGAARQMTHGAVAADAVPARRRRASVDADTARERIVLYALVVVLAVIFVAPIVWGFFNSLRELHEGVTGPVIPDPAHWSNYHYAWSGLFEFSHYLWNTVVLTLLATVPAVFSSALAGYAFARMRV